MRPIYTLCLFLLFFALPLPVLAASPFESGWQLDKAHSQITFMSVKKSKVAETSSFAAIDGQITEDGIVVLQIALDSVDTKIDLRNVRMRFLFFETFQHPEARVTALLDPAQLADLPQMQRMAIELPVTLALHGIEAGLTAKVHVTLLSNDRVNVATVDPIPIALSDFQLEAGRAKLEEAANVTIMPLTMVSLNLTFDRNRAVGGTVVAAAAQSGADTALETAGNFDRTACVGRFEILSRTDSITFASGTSRLTAGSRPLLDSLYDIVSRCPDMVIEIGGHTDSDGSRATNQRLSEKRATAVAGYLAQKGIPHARMKVVGYGEARPIVSNDTADGRARNRRIEFAVLN
jgi:outer membrane protein OmpA-like peptidoglycan-associated protein